jgi:hypothetical protein
MSPVAPAASTEPNPSVVPASNESASPAAVAADGNPAAKTEAAPAASEAAPVYEFKNPDGTPADAEHATELSALAAEYKLSAEQATKLYTRDIERANARQAALAAQWQAAADDAEARSRADPVIGGDKFEETLAHAKLVSDKYSPKGFSVFAVAERIGAHKDPDFLRFMEAIYAGQKEPTKLVGGAPAAPRRKSDAEVAFPEMYAQKE